jgi:formamidopyrimidine-DNA glycosylase
MPELPEAEAQRRLLDRCVVGQTIERVETKEQGGGARDGQVDDKVLDGDVASLAGARVVAAKRKGKQLWLELDKGKTKHCLLIHLGMTGSCVIKGEAPPSYKAFSIDDAFPPKYTKLELVMDDGTRLAYCDPRRFGRVKLRGAEPEELAALAPDALEAPAVAAMRSALSSKSAPIKAVLLDQSAVVCGIGNWVADEVLYMSRIHPATAAAALSADQVKALRAAIVNVCKTACDANADSEQFPATWLFHHRWAKMTTGSIASPIGRIHFDTIGGRTTAFLPDVQKKTGGTTKPSKKPAAAAKPASKKKRAAKKPSAAKKRRTSPRTLSK